MSDTAASKGGPVDGNATLTFDAVCTKSTTVINHAMTGESRSQHHVEVKSAGEFREGEPWFAMSMQQFNADPFIVSGKTYRVTIEEIEG